MGSDPLYAKYPLLPLAQDVFTITNPSSTKPAKQTALKSLQDAIAEHKMAPLYRYLAHPTDGIVNSSGQGSILHPPRIRQRKPSAAGMVASKHSIRKVDIPWDETVCAKLQKENDEELE